MSHQDFQATTKHNNYYSLHSASRSSGRFVVELTRSTKQKSSVIDHGHVGPRISYSPVIPDNGMVISMCTPAHMSPRIGVARRIEELSDSGHGGLLYQNGCACGALLLLLRFPAPIASAIRTDRRRNVSYLR